jgi:hypothetical protein
MWLIHGVPWAYNVVPGKGGVRPRHPLRIIGIDSSPQDRLIRKYSSILMPGFNEK